jgi:NADH:ubiquinone oxidoreductase subunit H
MCALTMLLFFGGWSVGPLIYIANAELFFAIKVVIGAFFLYWYVQYFHVIGMIDWWKLGEKFFYHLL